MKLCLIGSSRFMNEYREANKALTLAGHIVYTVAAISTSISGGEYGITKDQKEILDLVHLRKILESDAVVLITDKTGYYGESTRREIRWASLINKDLYFPEDVREAYLSINDKWIKAKAKGTKEAMDEYYDYYQESE